MNYNQIKDKVFGRDVLLMAAVEALLVNTLVTIGEQPTMLLLADRRLDENGPSLDAKNLYDYFRKHKVVQRSGSYLYPGHWFSVNKPNHHDVNTVRGIADLAHTVQIGWAEKALSRRHIERIQETFDKLKFTTVVNDAVRPIGPVFKVTLPGERTAGERITFEDFLPLIYKSASHLVVTEKETFLVFAGFSKVADFSLVGNHTVLASAGVESFKDEFYRVLDSVRKQFDQVVYRGLDIAVKISKEKNVWLEETATKLLKEWGVYTRAQGHVLILSPRLLPNLTGDVNRITQKDRLVEILRTLERDGVDTGMIPGGMKEHYDNSSYLGKVVSIVLGTPVENYPLAEFINDLKDGETFKVPSRKLELASIQPNKMTILTKKERGLYKKYYQLLLDLFQSWTASSRGVTLASADLDQDSFVLVQGAPIHRPDIDAIIGCLVSFNYLGVNRTDKGMIRVTPGLKDTEEGYTLRTLHFSDSMSGKPGKGDMYVADGIQYQTFYQYNDIGKMLLALHEGGELHSYLFGKPLHRIG